VTNDEKFFEILQKIIDFSDDPRIVINVSVGMQLSEWMNKKPGDPETKADKFNENSINKTMRIMRDLGN
jgi:hypothetical protein